MKKATFLFPIIIILLISSCRRDFDNFGPSVTETPDPIIENFVPELVQVNSSVDGQIQDVNKQPIQDAIVQLGNLTTMTNEFGLFSFEEVDMNQKGTLISVTKNGFIDGSRRFFPRKDNNSMVIIEMIPTIIRATFDASLGGTIFINNNAEVVFAPNSIGRANGEIYQGEVSVIHTYLDPTASTTADRMPGNLQGIRTNPEELEFLIEEVAIQSFGMINVILQDENGAPLNILNGWDATIRVALPEEIAANAPNQIPLWSFNEEFGIWIEDGSANKINGKYVGEVSHFSWWNCDVPFPLIELDLTLEDANNNPISNHAIAIGFGTDAIASYYSYSNSEGFVTGKIPAGLELLLQIRGLCGEIIHSTIIGPFNENTSLGTINVVDPNINNTPIAGSIVDCNGNLIDNGGVITEVDGLSFIALADNGTFDFFLSNCEGPTNVTITAIDFDNLLQSELINGTVGTVVNTGALQVCGNPVTDNFLTISVGNETYLYSGDELTGGIIPNSNLINIQFTKQDSLAETLIGLNALNGTTAGNYDNNNSCTIFDSAGVPPYSLSGPNPNQSINFANFNISQLSPNIVGTFSDILINDFGSTPDTVLVSGSFLITP